MYVMPVVVDFPPGNPREVRVLVKPILLWRTTNNIFPILEINKNSGSTSSTQYLRYEYK